MSLAQEEASYLGIAVLALLKLGPSKDGQPLGKCHDDWVFHNVELCLVYQLAKGQLILPRSRLWVATGFGSPIPSFGDLSQGGAQVVQHAVLASIREQSISRAVAVRHGLFSLGVACSR